METTAYEDIQRILLEPIIHDTEGLDPQQVSQGMKKEVQQMKHQSIFTEIGGNTMTPEQQANIVESRWALKQKQNNVRAQSTNINGLHTESSSHNGTGLQLLGLYRACKCCISTRSSNLIQLGNATAARVLQ